MKLEVAWATTYSYSEPVRVLHTELRVLPASRFGQKVISAKVGLEPEAHLSTARDAFGNQVNHFDHLGSVDRLHVSIEAVVETVAGLVEAPALTPLEYHLYRQPTGRCPFNPAVDAFAAGAKADAPNPYAGEVMALMADQFTFQTGHTDVSDTALGLLEKQHGVCQDFAHLMLAVLRMRDIPARYVSGYLATGMGTDATHAWVQLWHDGAWRGYDPANHCEQDERYVVIGVGRDYDDVAPIRGSFRGSAEEDWRAVVRVEGEQQQ